MLLTVCRVGTAHRFAQEVGDAHPTEKPLASTSALESLVSKSPAPIAPPSSVELPRANAIHRALLTGLLGNVGMKTDAFEYTGPRGKRFSLFPGSSLFKRRPQWVMAAELVETTKLYARTVGP